MPSNDDAYDELGKIGSIIDNATKYHIYEFKILSNNNTSNISVYKEALIEHGAISAMVNADYENNFNTTTYAHYYPNGTEDDLEHEVVIVGWDDNFSKYNFLTTPPGDGAWIIRNSWGEDWADHDIIIYLIMILHSEIIQGNWFILLIIIIILKKIISMIQ